MLSQCGLEAALPGCPSLEAGVEVYHSFPGFQRGEAVHGVVAFDIEVIAAIPKAAPKAKQKSAPRKEETQKGEADGNEERRSQ